MTEPLNQLLADGAYALVHESFTGVAANWWWERRMGGGIAVCQELDPAAMAREVAERTGREEGEVRRVIAAELGLEDAEPVVLTFEIPDDTTAADASCILAERSATPEGLAANLYRRVEEAIGA
jgi:hypothetical protein